VIRTRIFQKYFLLAISTLILFLVLGFYANNLIIRLLRSHNEPLAPVFMAKVVDRLNAQNKVDAVRELSGWHGPHGPQLVLLNDQGQVLFPEDFKLDFDWNSINKPEHPYDFTRLEKKSTLTPHFRFSPPGPGGPGGPAIIRLNGEPANYLYMEPAKGLPGEHPVWFPLLGIGSMVISLLLGVGTALSLIYYSVNKSVKLADQVLSEIQGGNLKARFPIVRKDEFGRAMMRFNKMADEIQNLVSHLKFVELARTKLLQELAHDLRTPVASLKSLLETLDSKGNRMEPAVQKEFMALSLREVDYFERLVEDLLFLAQVNEPKYHNKNESVKLNQLLSEEADDLALRWGQGTEKIILSKKMTEESLQYQGDPHLLRRLFRNALENAFSFAKSSVEISFIKDADQKLIITIEDDGPGFSPEALRSYGERRLSRKLETSTEGRLSVGLGSVVMKAICLVHRGQIQISNRTDGRQNIMGATVRIIL
jgi:signal transduction histidine kinase